MKWLNGKIASLQDYLTPLLLIAASVEFILGGIELIANLENEGISGLISALQFCLSAAIRQKRPFFPHQSILLGITQFGLNGSCTAIYAFSPSQLEIGAMRESLRQVPKGSRRPLGPGAAFSAARWPTLR